MDAYGAVNRKRATTKSVSPLPGTGCYQVMVKTRSVDEK